MKYNEAIRHLFDSSVISAVFNAKTREAIRTVVKHAKDSGYAKPEMDQENKRKESE